MEFVSPEAHSCAKFKKTRFLQATGALLLAIFTLVTLSAISPQRAHAGQASLAWNADTSTGVTGYKLYYGTASGNYSQNVDVGNVTSYTLSNLKDAQNYYFAAVAYNSAGSQSGYSNEVSYTTPALSPPTAVYTISASAGSGGSISPAGSVAVSQGLSQSFSITPNTGYTIAGVTVDGTSVGAVSTYTFSNVTANHTISATFSATSSGTSVNTYTLTASAGTGGSINPSGSVSVSSGATKIFTITPNSGYKVSNVTVDGASVGAVSTYTFSNVTSNHSISATFAPNTVTTTSTTKYSITTSAINGTISPSGTVSVAQGANQTITMTGNYGRCLLSSLVIDGHLVPSTATNTFTYTFTNVTANHTIQAIFVWQ